MIKIPSTDETFSLNDENLTQSCQLSHLKNNMTKCVFNGMKNLTRRIADQKSSQLCVPISITNLIRHAMKHDLGFMKVDQSHSFENILSSLVLVIYPRSMAGINMNPKIKETERQTTQIETLLQRVCYKTFLMPSGWKIIRKLGDKNDSKPHKSICQYERGEF